MESINYDKIAAVYDIVRTGEHLIVDRIIQEGNIHPKSTVLEIGCGTGNHTVLMEKISGAAVFGLEQSAGMLSKAAAKPSKIKFLQGNAITLQNCESNCFDVVYMIDVIHHIQAIDTMFHNICRVLKPRGKVFIFTDTHEHIRNRLTTKYFPATLEPELARYPSSDEIISAMKNNHFSSIQADTVILPDDENYGETLLQLAKHKGYSMFNLIPQPAIDAGIAKIKADLHHGNIVYPRRAPYLTGCKQNQPKLSPAYV